MIDEFKLKNKSKRLILSLRTNQTEPLSSIDLTSILTRLSSLYYKTDLLNSIAIAINQGVNYEDICILRKSLKNTATIPNYDNIDLYSNSDFLYRQGFVQCLSSNKDFFEINILLDSFKEINNLLYQNELKTLYTRKLAGFIEVYYKEGFIESINFLYKTPFEFNKHNYRMLDRSLKSSLERAMSKHKKFIEDINDIKDVKKRLSGDFDEIKVDTKQVFNSSQRRIVRKYIEPFFESFNNNDFPIILINEGSEFDLLCNYHLNKSNFKNPFFFDIKEVSHNSPILFVIGMALNIISPFLIAYLGVLKTQKTYWEKEKAKEETKALRKKRDKQEYIEKQLNEISELIEKYSIGEKILDEKVLDEIYRIKSDYYRERLLEISENIKDEYEYLIKDYSFIVNDSRVE